MRMEELMVNLRLSTASVAVMAIVLAACGPATTTAPASQAAASQAAAGEPIPMRIGALTPQTGGLSGIVAALEEALRMGQEEINAVEDGLVTIDFADDGTSD